MFLFKMPLAEAGITALLGYAVVFLGLVLLMLVVMALGKIRVASSKKKAAAPAAAPAVQAEKPAAAPAPGTAGELKLHDVSPRDAALIMAIVADKLGRPLNELRFKSIKEVK